jgi:hypothetical protein
VNLIEIPKVDIDVDCDSLSVGKTSRQGASRMVFAPDVLRGTRLVAWTLDWSVPFKVTNFLLLTTEQVRYIIVIDDSAGASPEGEKFLLALNRSLPDALNKQVVNKSELGSKVKDENDYKVRLIAYGAAFDSSAFTPLAAGTFKRLLNPDLSLVLINGSRTNGTIRFYMKTAAGFGPEGSSPYVEYIDDFNKEKPTASLMGAVFAQDKDTYDCLMKKAFTRLNYTVAVYAARTDVLGSTISSPSECPGAYQSAKTVLLGYHAAIQAGDAASIYDSAKRLANYNHALKVSRCSRVVY